MLTPARPLPSRRDQGLTPLGRRGKKGSLGGNALSLARTARWRSVLILSQLIVLLLRTRSVAAEAGYTNLQVRETTLTLRAEATARRFIAAHGRRGLVAGYAAESLEGWVYPFRIFHDYRVSFRLEGESEALPGPALVREVVVNPESVTRVYSGQKFTVRETLFVPLDIAGFAILYQVQSHELLHIVLSFRPDLDLMWPGGIGGQDYDWDAARHAFLLTESSSKYSALVGSPLAGNHTAPGDYSRPWAADRKLSLELDVPAEAAAPLSYPLVVACGIPGHYDAGKIYESILEETPKLFREAVQHYQDLAASNVQVETPDREVNLAYTWARITLDQAYVCNPFLGCGLVAGYGPSRDTRRPQYAWFFGGDAMVNTLALEAAGDHRLARDALLFIRKNQKKDTGEIFHELSQSAGLIDWFKDYPYGYRHTDASAMYLLVFQPLPLERRPGFRALELGLAARGLPLPGIARGPTRRFGNGSAGRLGRRRDHRRASGQGYLPRSGLDGGSRGYGGARNLGRRFRVGQRCSRPRRKSPRLCRRHVVESPAQLLLLRIQRARQFVNPGIGPA